jgi:hypothetical protein
VDRDYRVIEIEAQEVEANAAAVLERLARAIRL